MAATNEGYDPAGYGAAVGEDYDALYPHDGLATESSAELIASLAHEHDDPGFLEFGIGTGRLALAVQAHGVRVAGIDGSAPMVAQLRRKPGGADIPVEIGDYRSTRAGLEGFSVVALVFNGIFDPRGPEAQLDIFRNAAQHLRPGGYFVVESWVLNDQQRSGEWNVIPRFVGARHVEFQLARYDIDTHRIERTLLHLREGRADFVAVADSYASPHELDLMGRFTGFERVARYADWTRRPFGAASAQHVTVYRRISEQGRGSDGAPA